MGSVYAPLIRLLPAFQLIFIDLLMKQESEQDDFCFSPTLSFSLLFHKNTKSSVLNSVSKDSHSGESSEVQSCFFKWTKFGKVFKGWLEKSRNVSQF